MHTGVQRNGFEMKLSKTRKIKKNLNFEKNMVNFKRTWYNKGEIKKIFL